MHGFCDYWYPKFLIIAGIGFLNLIIRLLSWINLDNNKKKEIEKNQDRAES